MANFAQLNENNVVMNVLVVDNNDIQNLPFPESEAVGTAYLNSFLDPATYAQTSFNGNFRFRYASVGYTFHPECGPHGGFAAPALFDYFVFDASTCEWVPPVPKPDSTNTYYWDDRTRSWIKEPTLTIVG